ncbi:hypothetical protein [Bdellovibrio sp. HCB209]|uniref:hypothetical protein n=1 Tax=Bdellovibrio sp. HCB209 TaxID=3394354 RepID=UPI0039B65466
MNKDLIIAFALGILVGWGVFKLTSPKTAPAPVEIAQTVSENENNDQAMGEPAPADMPKIPEQATNDFNGQIPSGTPLAAPADVPPVPPRNVNLELTEESLEMLEQNITELHSEVTVERDNEGWILHFNNPDNYFSSIGLADNDRIPFTQFEEMRQNPEQQEMASRIETILSNLEK